MGKNERGWAEQVEKDVTSALNNGSNDVYIQSIADSIIAEINNSYVSRIVKAIWTGASNYKSPGDIEVTLDNNIVIPIELKVSKSNQEGTLANCSTNAFGKFVDSNIVSYDTFDQNLGLKQKRYELVESAIGNGIKLSNASMYEEKLRFIRDNVDKKFTKKISNITKPGKIGYAEYSSNLLNKNLGNLQTWVDSLLLGYNTLDGVTVNSGLAPRIYCVVKHFSSPAQKIKFYNFSKINTKVVDTTPLNDNKKKTPASSIRVLNNNNETIIRICIHWKNICQGGAGPCMNVFLGNAK